MIQINYFNSSQYQRRWPIITAAINELCNIKENNKKEIKIVIYYNIKNRKSWDETISKLQNHNIKVSTVELERDEYRYKLDHTVMCDSEYFCKWDDDVFINRHVWDFMIENVNILDDESISVIGPTLSNGIPSVELFIKDFLTNEEKKEVKKIFLSDNIPSSVWGCNYEEICKYINNLTEWDGDKYWEFVDKVNVIKNTKNLPWFYHIIKGVHPARFSYKYNYYIANHTIDNKEMVLDKQDFKLEKYLTPYFCNNLFITKTSYYKEGLKLFNDGWDEGQLTLLAQKTNKTPVYVRNCYGIHMAYGCTKNQHELENLYMEKFFKKIT